MTKISIKLACTWAIILSAVFCSVAHADDDDDESPYKYERKMKGPILLELIGQGVPTSGDTAEIIKKAQSCAARNLTNGPISSSGILNILTGTANTANGDANLIELADPVGGQLVLNAQIPFSFMMVGQIARAKIIVEAKTDRFRVLLTSPSVLRDNNSHNASDIVVAFGTGGQQAIDALLAAANKVSACVVEVEKKEW